MKLSNGIETQNDINRATPKTKKKEIKSNKLSI